MLTDQVVAPHDDKGTVSFEDGSPKVAALFEVVRAAGLAPEWCDGLADSRPLAVATTLEFRI